MFIYCSDLRTTGTLGIKLYSLLIERGLFYAVAADIRFHGRYLVPLTVCRAVKLCLKNYSHYTHL